MVETSPRLPASSRQTLAGQPSRDRLARDHRHAARTRRCSSSATNSSTPCRSASSSSVGGDWRERAVGLDDDGRAALRRRRRRRSTRRCCPPTPQTRPTAPSSRSRRPAAALMAAIAARIAEHGGAGLFFDYGHLEPGVGDTLQAVRRHTLRGRADNPGEADLTAHVDFAALAAGAARARPRRPSHDAGRLPARHGLLERAGRLGAGADAAAREQTARRGRAPRRAGRRWESCSRCWRSLPRRRSPAALRPRRLTCTPALPHCRAPERGSGRAGATSALTKPVPAKTTRRQCSTRHKPDPLRSPAARQPRQPASATAISPASAASRDGIYPGPQHRHRLGRRSRRWSRENRRRVADWMGVAADHLLTAYQIHSPDVIVVREPFAGERPKADAHRHRPAGHRRRRLDRRLRPGAVCRCRRRASSAPPMPAGKAPSPACWKTRSRRWSGSAPGASASSPCSARRSAASNYEVGPEFVERFVAADAGNARYFAPSGNAGPRHVRPQPLHGRPAAPRPA